MKPELFIGLLSVLIGITYGIARLFSSRRSKGLISRAPYEDGMICLITPENVFNSRIGGNHKSLTDYIKQVTRITRVYFKSLDSHIPLSGAVFVAVRPGFLSRAWVEIGPPGISPSEVTTLVSKIEGLRPLNVTDGPVVFATKFRTWGGGVDLVDSKDFPFPLPAAWYEAFATFRGGMLPDDALLKVWPEQDA